MEGDNPHIGDRERCYVLWNGTYAEVIFDPMVAKHRAVREGADIWEGRLEIVRLVAMAPVATAPEEGEGDGEA